MISPPNDPRYFQIISLSAFVAAQMIWFDFAPELAVLALNMAAALVTQWIACRIVGAGFDYRSPLITSLSLTILLKASALWVYPLAAIFAITSKFTLRSGSSHIFNPANFAIVALLLALPDYVWVAPGQWGATMLTALMIVGFGLSVLTHVKGRFDMGFLFLGIWSALAFIRALWLGDPMGIPAHQLQNGALLIFAFFMISDPKTIPAHFHGRIVFALSVALFAFTLTHVFQVREALFYALAALCLMRPIFDAIWRATPYNWPQKEKLL